MASTLHLVIAGGGLVAAAALGACVAQRARAGRAARSDQEATVSASTSAGTTSDDVPPLDLAARHVRYQTATFALG